MVTVTNIGTPTASFVSRFGFTTRGADRGDFGEQPSCGISLPPIAVRWRYLHAHSERGADGGFRGRPGVGHCPDTRERHGHALGAVAEVCSITQLWRSDITSPLC